MDILGFLSPSPFAWQPEIGTTPQLEEVAEGFPIELFTDFHNVIFGPKETTVPIEVLPKAEKIGYLYGSYGFLLFFNRIHVLPNSINVGNLANNQTRTIEIFNAFLSETQTLEEIGLNGNLSGVTLSATAPEVFPPMASKFFTLSINTAGSPAFDGFFNFVFDNATAPPLSVRGQRIIPFVFAHNWQTLPIESVEYLTKIYETIGDLETAVKHRPFPRRRLKYRHTVLDNPTIEEIAEKRAELEAVVYSWMHRPYALPIWEDQLYLSSLLAAGATEVPANPVGLDFDEGGYIIFWRNASEYELIEISEVTGSAIKFTRATERDWQAATIIMPARLARLQQSVDFVKETEELLEFETTWIVEPDQRSINRIGTFSAPTYRGFPIWLAAYRFADQLENMSSRKQTIFDYQIGARSVIPAGINPRGNFPNAVINVSRAEMAAFYGFLNDRAGKLNPAWFPSWSKDFQLIDDAGNGATAIAVRGNRFSNVYATGANRKDIMIRWNDDYKFYVRIESAAPIDENSENLLLAAPLPRALLLTNYDRISFLKFARLEADSMEITKESTTISRAEFTCRELVASE